MMKLSLSFIIVYSLFHKRIYLILVLLSFIVLNSFRIDFINIHLSLLYIFFSCKRREWVKRKRWKKPTTGLNYLKVLKLCTIKGQKVIGRKPDIPGLNISQVLIFSLPSQIGVSYFCIASSSFPFFNTFLDYFLGVW